MNTTALAPSKIVVPGNTGTKVVKSITIQRPRSELYRFWRNPENLALVIKHPVRITVESSTVSHWTVSGPPGDSVVEWTALVINDTTDSLIAWRTGDGASVAHAGSVRFETAAKAEGTEVTVALEYDLPGGKIGELWAKIMGKEPGQQVADTLRRLKELMEGGEIPINTARL